MIHLNQYYNQEATYSQFPKVREIEDAYKKFCLEDAKWHKYGRSFDCAVSLYNVDFKDKVVYELGARDSLFCSYLTKDASKVFASDVFLGWGDLGDLDYWTKLWKKSAINPERLTCEFQDMTSLTYADDSADIVVSFSAIEHIHQGDTKAIIEASRVCKPGGTIIIGTDACASHNWVRGGYFYDNASLKERLIDPSGCELIGETSFDFNNCDKHNIGNFQFTSCIFFLKKPE